MAAAAALHEENQCGVRSGGSDSRGWGEGSDSVADPSRSLRLSGLQVTPFSLLGLQQQGQGRPGPLNSAADRAGWSGAMEAPRVHPLPALSSASRTDGRSSIGELVIDEGGGEVRLGGSLTPEGGASQRTSLVTPAGLRPRRSSVPGRGGAGIGTAIVAAFGIASALSPNINSLYGVGVGGVGATARPGGSAQPEH